MKKLIISFILCLFISGISNAGEDILIADFEGKDYGDWSVQSSAFGSAPMAGKLATEKGFSQFIGNGIASSRDLSEWPKRQGRITSPKFKIQRKYINFLIGGGNHAWRTCVNLVIERSIEKVEKIRSSAGYNNEKMVWVTWDVSELMGKTVWIEVMDNCEEYAWSFINVDHIYQSDTPRAAVSGSPEFATKSMKAEAQACQLTAAVRDLDDPRLPYYHYSPPGQMTDPHGPIYYNGYYHVFYQNHAFANKRGGNKHWGHARSKDLVHWETLPIAIWPSYEYGEHQCFSGSLAVNSKGEPRIFYTYIPPINAAIRQQWIAVPQDKDLIEWVKHPANPILHLKTQDGPEDMGSYWRDPFVFTEKGRTFLVLAPEREYVPLYEAVNDDWTDWTFKGKVYSRPGHNPECPSLFKMKNSKGKYEWVYLSSPMRNVEYVFGDFDWKNYKLNERIRGDLNHSINFYAVYPMFEDSGRITLFAMYVEGLRWEGHFKWRQSLVLPRVFTIGDDGLPRQRVVDDMKKLRETHTKVRPFGLNDKSRVLSDVRGDCYEMIIEFEPKGAKQYGVKVRRSDDGKRSVDISYDGSTLNIPGGDPIPFKLGKDKKLKLQIFVDKWCLDVVVNDGRLFETRVMYHEFGDDGVEVYAKEGGIKIRSLNAWKMKKIYGRESN